LIAALPIAFALAAAAPAGSPTPDPAPTFCVEWIRQSTEGYERLTLFADRTLVWKLRRGATEDVKRRVLEADEAAFYCRYFSRPEIRDVPGDLRTHLTGEFARSSQMAFALADGVKRVMFDELSPMPAEAGALRSSIAGLRAAFENPLAPASRFAPEKLAPGMVLRRFDGARFRIELIDREKGIVELAGVTEPYREFRRAEELRFLFEAPE